MQYAIRVRMTPYKTDSPAKPYFWHISESEDGICGWCIVDSGWAKAPDEAWQAAQNRYKAIEGGKHVRV